MFHQNAIKIKYMRICKPTLLGMAFPSPSSSKGPTAHPHACTASPCTTKKHHIACTKSIVLPGAELTGLCVCEKRRKGSC